MRPRTGVSLRFFHGLAFCLWVELLLPAAGSAQGRGTIGIHGGQVRSHQVWSGPISTDDATGLTVGVNVDIPTPVTGLSVRAGAGYWGRGSLIWDSSLDPEGVSPGKVRSHFLGVTLQGKLGIVLGPATAYLVAGPTFEQLLDTECSSDLCGILVDERPTNVGAAVGAGLGISIAGGYRVEVETLFTEGLTEAHRSPTSGIRYRSLEFLVRFAVPFRVEDLSPSPSPSRGRTCMGRTSQHGLSDSRVTRS
jgi:hypothetical protein